MQCERRNRSRSVAARPSIAFVALEQPVENRHHQVVVQKLQDRRLEARAKPSFIRIDKHEVEVFPAKCRIERAALEGTAPAPLDQNSRNVGIGRMLPYERRDRYVIRAQERDELFIDEIIVAVAVAVGETSARGITVTRLLQ